VLIFIINNVNIIRIILINIILISIVLFIIIVIIIIIIIIIFKKTILLLLKKNHRFDLKGKIKNYKNLGLTCLILLLIL
jgi:hypothetical protein